MATTTPNFGWPVPTSTDLVKDGATAIEALGDAVDASLLDLKGGTSGQVLAKNSNTDMDFVWVAQDDSNAIQNAIVDAKGDLIGATAADTPARLAVGTDGHVLTADSTTATGLKWAAAGSGSAVGCRLTKSATQALANGVETAITFNGESWDTNAFHDNATNNTRITIPAGKAGKYAVYMECDFEALSGQPYSHLKKNGATVSFPEVREATGGGFSTKFTSYVLIDLAVADYIELFLHQNSGSSKNVGTKTSFGVDYLGA